jgi:heat-inducible transcriptional repressor
MIPQRSLEVLRAIVEDYVQTNQPVGSKSLLDRHPLGVSAATIRNDMALLEEEELIVAPHTSSGRIPTDKGYRLFVEQIREMSSISKPEKKAIESFLNEQLSLEELLQHSAKTLSQLTNSLALISYPSFGGSYIRHIELIPVNETRVLVMLISSSGQIQQHVALLGESISDELLQDIRGRLNGQLSGQPLAEVSKRGEEMLQELSASAQKQTKPIVDTLQSLVDENLQEKVAVSGAANLVRSEADFDGFAPLLEMMEEQVALLKLLRETELERDGLGITIGSENTQQGLSGASLLIGEYGDNENSARVGILGPTRMNYRGNIASLRAVARYLSKSVNGN